MKLLISPSVPYEMRVNIVDCAEKENVELEDITALSLEDLSARSRQEASMRSAVA